MATASLSIYVQPLASRTEIVGWHGDAIKIRLKAPPVDGAANEELIRFLSKAVRVPRSAVRIAGGATKGKKRIEIAGVDQAEALSRLGL